MIRILLGSVAAAVLAACSSAVPEPEANTEVEPPAEVIQTPSQLIKLENFESDHVIPRNVTIWLPPGYDPDGAPYPVIYAHDGQNTFESETAYTGVAWELDDIAEDLIADGKIPSPIIVGMWNTVDTRWLEYMPQGIMDAVPDDAFKRTGEDGGPIIERPPLRSDAYLKFVVEEMKPYIDANYNTAPDQANTTIMGSSMGGLVSLYAIAEYPDVFSRAACVSTHWPLAGPTGPIADAATDAVLTYLEASALDKAKHTLWFDHGTETLDAFYARHAGPIEEWFRDNDWSEDHVSFKVFEGTDHSEAAWQTRTDQVLLFLLAD